MTNAALRGKPDAGNPHVRFDEGEVASTKPRRGSLLYESTLLRVLGLAITLVLSLSALAKPAGMSVFHVHLVEMAKQRGASLMDAALAAKSWGINGVDLWFDKQEAEGEELVAAGLKPVSVIVFMDFAVTNDIGRAERAIAYAKRVGSPRIMLVPGYFSKEMTREDAWRVAKPRFADFVARVTQAGLEVNVEDFDYSQVLLGSREHLREAFAEFPKLGHVLDTGNYVFWDGDVLAACDEFLPRIRHVHVKDRAKDDPKKSVAAGTGSIPVAEVVARLKRGGYGGWLALECFGSTNMWEDIRLSAMTVGAALVETEIAVDFAKRTGEVRPALHSSSWRSPLTYDYGHPEKSLWMRKLHLKAWRSHDAPLVDAAERVIDTHFIFPLMHLDAKNPQHYYFEATDNLIRKVREEDGLEVFYRLGSSVEHTSDRNAVNTQPPKDPEKYAEVLAGIVRHYNRGWANGHRWNIRYWELFNEPDVRACCRATREQFIELFVTCLKRLKAEFGDEIKVGGPAFAGIDKGYVRALLGACKKAGVTPDFFSWHHYGKDPDMLIAEPEWVRKLVAECGFPNMELILNEWHYIKEWDWSHRWRREPSMLFDCHQGPSGQCNVDSAAYTLAVETGFQNTCLDQSYFYGCGWNWSDWGYWNNIERKLNKTYYAMQIMGELVKNGKWKLATTSSKKGVYSFAAVSADGRKALVAIADYKTGIAEIAIDLKGAEGFKLERAMVLDYTHDLDPFDATVAPTGRIVIRKNDVQSACYLLELKK